MYSSDFSSTFCLVVGFPKIGATRNEHQQRTPKSLRFGILCKGLQELVNNLLPHGRRIRVRVGVEL